MDLNSSEEIMGVGGGDWVKGVLKTECHILDKTMQNRLWPEAWFFQQIKTNGMGTFLGWMEIRIYM